MNFLAHLLLSGNHPELMVGNFIADHVKGNRKSDYPEGIRSGIELHRHIDRFTDTHPVTSSSKRLLYPTQQKYAPVVVDLFYDHFLAVHFNAFSDVSLQDFTSNAYRILKEYENQLPASVQAFLPHMIERDWLSNYITIEGIGRSLNGLSKRVRFENRMAFATEDLHRHYGQLDGHFRLFFPELITFVGGRPHETLS